MRRICFTRRERVPGVGWVPLNRIYNLEDDAAAEVLSKVPGAVDITPDPVANAYDITEPDSFQTHTTLRMIQCNGCKGAKRMTPCETCRGAGFLLKV